MPRQPRIDSPGLLHHIIARGNERRNIFSSSYDYQDFLARLARLLTDCGNPCFAWALMPNHIHLLVRSGVQGISRMLHRLLGGYAIAFNLRYGRVGHLFQNRFKSIICEDEPYFLELVRYIHLNPLRAGLVKSLEELRAYPWTGHPALMGAIQLPWQSTTEVLERWGQDPPSARTRYEQFLREGLDQGYREDLVGGGLLRSLGGLSNALQARAVGMLQQSDLRILGSGEFVEKILGPLEAEDSSARALVDIQDVIRTVSEATGLPDSELCSASRTRRVSKAKALLIHWGVVNAGKTLRQMADLTRMSDSAATRARRRGQRLGDVMNLPNLREQDR